MANFISDEEMERLEASQPKKFISDEEMIALESQEPSFKDKAKSFIESNVIDQLPELGAAGGGTIGGLIGAGAGGVGMVPGALGGAGLGGYLGKAAQNLYNTSFRPEKAPTSALDYVSEPVTSAVEGVATEGVGLGAAKAIGLAGKSLQSPRQKVSDYLRNKANVLAEKATGATGKASEEFVQGTGRELLDRGIVKFGSSPNDIAKKANAALEAAQVSKENIINNKLKTTNVDRNKVYNAIRERIKELSGDESQIDLVRQLESKLNDILDVSQRSSSEVPLAKSESIRRGFDEAAKWSSNTDAPTRQANRIVANAYRDAGENAAILADPELGKLFKKDKATQHLLIPVAEAAEKRAAQLKQSPHGGLLDMTSAGLGGIIGTAMGGPVGTAMGAGAGLAAKTLRPRYASMGAVTADVLSKALQSSPSAAKYAPLIEEAASRGPEAFKTTLRLLSHRPEFQEVLQTMEHNPELRRTIMRNTASDRREE